MGAGIFNVTSKAMEKIRIFCPFLKVRARRLKARWLQARRLRLVG